MRDGKSDFQLETTISFDGRGDLKLAHFHAWVESPRSFPESRRPEAVAPSEIPVMEYTKGLQSLGLNVITL